MNNQQAPRTSKRLRLPTWISAVTLSFAAGLLLPFAFSHFHNSNPASANVATPSCSSSHFLELVTRWYVPYSVDQAPYLGGSPAYCRNGWGLLMNFEANSRPGTATALFKVKKQKWSLVTIVPAAYAGEYYCAGLPPAAVREVGLALACRESLPSSSK